MQTHRFTFDGCHQRNSLFWSLTQLFNLFLFRVPLLGSNFRLQWHFEMHGTNKDPQRSYSFSKRPDSLVLSWKVCSLTVLCVTNESHLQAGTNDWSHYKCSSCFEILTQRRSVILQRVTLIFQWSIYWKLSSTLWHFQKWKHTKVGLVLRLSPVVFWTIRT